MEELGLDGQHEGQRPRRVGEIQRKRGDTLNMNLAHPIPQFPPRTKLAVMRRETGEMEVEAIRAAVRQRSSP